MQENYADVGVILLMFLVVPLLVGVGLVILPLPKRASADKKNRRIVPSDEMLDYAERAVEREDYELALDLCSQIFEQPQAYEIYPQALELRIEILVELQRYDAALQDMQRLKRLEPDTLSSMLVNIEVDADAPHEFLSEARKITAEREA